MSSSINKAELISKIQKIEGLTNEERSSLIGLLREHKKYGLVWEDKPEDVPIIRKSLHAGKSHWTMHGIIRRSLCGGV